MSQPLAPRGGLVGLALLAILLLPRAGAGHTGSVPCSGCHAGDQPGSGDGALLTASQSTLCGTCHANAVHASHPVAVRPARTVPADLPLDARGRVNCTTCHEVHQAGLPGTPARLPGRQLCIACHARTFFESMADGGASIFAFGHVAAGEDPRDAALDPFSRQCLTCHFGHGASGAARALGPAGSGGHPGHPIGVSYSRAMSYGGFRPRPSLPAEMLLPGDRVACVSCHTGYTRHHGALLVRNSRPGLCSRCHAL